MGGCSGCGKRAASAAILGAPAPSAISADGLGVPATTEMPMPETVMDFWARLEACIRANPWIAILVALVVGVYLGRRK